MYDDISKLVSSREIERVGNRRIKLIGVIERESILVKIDLSMFYLLFN